MRFVRKKNLHIGEELLFIPRLHWMFIVRHMIWSLPLIIILLVLWVRADARSGVLELINSIEGISLGTGIAQTSEPVFRYVFLGAVLFVLLVFLWSIIKYACIEYGITNKRLMMKKGVFRVFTSDIPTDRIESIHCRQGIGGRMFNYGTLCFSGVGGMKPAFYMVSRPYSVRRKVAEITERNKNITVVHGNMPWPLPVKREPPPEPAYRYGAFVRVIPAEGRK